MKSITNNIMMRIMVVCFVLICCSGFSALMPFRIILIGIFAFCRSLINLRGTKLKIVTSQTGFWLVVFILLIIAGLPSSYDKLETVKYLYIYIAIASMILLPDNDTYHTKVLEGIDGCSKFIAISIIINLVIPNLFRDYLFFLISGGRSDSTRLTQEISSGIYSGILGEKGEAAFMMVVAIIILLGKCAYEKKVNRENGIWLCIYLIALLLPAKRMLFVVGIMICMLYLIFWMRGTKRLIAIGGFSILGYIGFLIVSKVPALNTLASRFSSYTNDNTRNGRIYLWQHAWKMFFEKPRMGYGYGSYNAYASNEGVILNANGQWTAQAHNIYYQLLGEMGITGTIVFIILVANSLYLFYKLYMIRDVLQKEDFILLFTGGNIQIMVLLYGYSGNIIYYSNQIMVFFWGVALMVYLRRKYSGKDKIFADSNQNIRSN